MLQYVRLHFTHVDNRRYIRRYMHVFVVFTVRVMAEHCRMCIHRDIYRYTEAYIETYIIVVHTHTHRYAQIHRIASHYVALHFLIAWHHAPPQCGTTHYTLMQKSRHTHTHTLHYIHTYLPTYLRKYERTYVCTGMYLHMYIRTYVHWHTYTGT